MNKKKNKPLKITIFHRELFLTTNIHKQIKFALYVIVIQVFIKKTTKKKLGH